MLEFEIDNIFVVLGGKVFLQLVGIPMGTKCASLLVDIFLYSYEAEFIQSLLSAGKKHWASQFNLAYRYIDDVLSINNPDFENYLGHMYPAELEIKDTTESNNSTSYLDLLLSIGRDGQLSISLNNKRDDFNVHITNYPFLSDNLQSSPAYGVFISRLIRYATVCSSNEYFILRVGDFNVSFSGRDMLWNCLNSPSGSSLVDMGISSYIMKYPSPKCYMTFWDMVIYSDNIPHWSDLSLNLDLVTKLGLITVLTLLPYSGRFR